MRKHLKFLGVFLLFSGCEPNQEPGTAVLRTHQVQLGTDLLAKALQSAGRCVGIRSEGWTFIADVGHGANATLVKNANAKALYYFFLEDQDGNSQLGSLELEQRAAYWFDPRELRGQARPTDDGSVAYPPQTLEEAGREWNTQRGQQMLALAKKAETSCGKRSKP